jgi:hypothetical protein
MIVTSEMKRSRLVLALVLLDSGLAIQAVEQFLVVPAFGVGRRAALRKAAAGISFFGTIAPAFANEDNFFLAEEETENILWRAEASTEHAPSVTALPVEIESSKDLEPPIEEITEQENLIITGDLMNEEKKDEVEVEARELSTVETTETTKESTPVIPETIESTNMLEVKVNENERSIIEIVSKDVPVEVKDVTLTTETKTDDGGAIEETTSITIADSSSNPAADTANSPSRRKTIEYICIERTIE